MTRIVNLLIPAETCARMQQQTDYKAWCDAVGYLATWNLTYSEVRIHEDGERDMIAVYFNEAGQRQYVIGAIWHEDHYGFHS